MAEPPFYGKDFLAFVRDIVPEQPAPYFLIEPPPRTIDSEILGPLAVSPAEREWINEVLRVIIAVECVSVECAEGTIRSDQVDRMADILESVVSVHVREQRLRETFPRSQWRRGEGREPPLVHSFTRRCDGHQ